MFRGFSPQHDGIGLPCEVLAENCGDVLEDAFGNVRLVHRINVHVRDAVGVEVDNLVGGVDDASLLHGFRIATELVDERLETLRHERTGKLDGAFHLVGVRNRHDAGEHWTVHASVAELVKETEEKVVVKDHLRREKVCASIHLFLEMLDIVGLICAFRVLFGVASRANAKVGIASLEFANKFHSVVVIAVSATIGDEFRREVATERHYVLDAGGLHVFDTLMDGFLGARNAGEVGEHRNPEIVLEILGYFERVLAHAATCAVRNAHECGVKLCNRFGSCFNVFKTRFFFWREHLEGEAHLVLLQDVDNLHCISVQRSGLCC